MFKWWRKHNQDGLEIPDTTPIEVTLRDKPLTIAEQLQRFSTNEEIRERLKNRGIDTFDEADDFDVPDMEDDERRSPYEAHFGGSLNGLQARLDEQKAGMTEEMPIDRHDRAKEALRPKKQPTAEPAAAAVKAEINA